MRKNQNSHWKMYRILAFNTMILNQTATSKSTKKSRKKSMIRPTRKQLSRNKSPSITWATNAKITLVTRATKMMETSVLSHSKANDQKDSWTRPQRNHSSMMKTKEKTIRYFLIIQRHNLFGQSKTRTSINSTTTTIKRTSSKRKILSITIKKRNSISKRKKNFKEKWEQAN